MSGATKHHESTPNMRVDGPLAKGALPEPSPFGNVSPAVCTPRREEVPCAKSSGFDVFRWGACFALTVFPASIAQAQSSPASQPGFSVGSLKATLDPLTTGLAHVLYAPVAVWAYIMDHPPAGTLLAAVLASTVAIVAIRNHRATARLRETFVTMNDDNWDEDVIKARTLFSQLKEQGANNPQVISVYGYPLQNADEAAKKIHEETAGTLRTILNDYENIALGIRANIIDETYLFRLFRGDFLRDWNALAPLVAAYRNRLGSQLIYVEFEGMTSAWEKNRSYRTGRKIKQARRKMVFR